MQNSVQLKSRSSLCNCLIHLIIQKCRRLQEESIVLQEKIEAFGDYNRHMAAEYFGRSVTAEEALRYYLDRHQKVSRKIFARRIYSASFQSSTASVSLKRHMFRCVLRYYRTLKIRVRNQRQIAEVLGDYNRWVASQEINRPVTRKEAIEHYVDHGGPVAFAEKRTSFYW